VGPQFSPISIGSGSLEMFFLPASDDPKRLKGLLSLKRRESGTDALENCEISLGGSSVSEYYVESVFLIIVRFDNRDLLMMQCTMWWRGCGGGPARTTSHSYLAHRNLFASIRCRSSLL